jgi:hypothetical protein
MGLLPSAELRIFPCQPLPVRSMCSARNLQIASRWVKEDCAPGKPTALSSEHELSLCNYTEYIANRGFPLTVTQILIYAWCIDRRSGRHIFGERGPCYGWWLKFRSRHPEAVKLRRPECLDRGRAIFSTIGNLRNYFQLRVLERDNFSERPQLPKTSTTAMKRSWISTSPRKRL